MSDTNDTIYPHHRLAKWAGIFLLITVPLAYAHNGHDIVHYLKLLFAQLGTFFMVIAWYIGTIQGTIRYKHHPLDLPILIFLLLNVLSWATLSINPFKSGLVVIRIFTFAILYFAITRTYHPSFLKPWVHFITIVAALISIIGICQYFALGFMWLRTSGLPSATFVMRNLASMYLIGVIPIALLPFLWASTIRSEISWGFAFTLPVIFLIYTRTRGAWVGLSMALIFFGLILLVCHKKRTDSNPSPQHKKSDHKHRTIRPLFKPKYYIATAYLIFIGFMSTLPTILPTRTNANYAIPPSKATVSQVAQSILVQNQDNPRFILWKHTLKMIQNHWFLGVGVGNWDLVFPKYERGEHTRPDYYALRPHNDPMWITAELGIFGILCIVLIWAQMFYFIFYHLFYLANKPHLQSNNTSEIAPKENNKEKSLLIGFGISLLAVSGHACFSFPYERIPPLLSGCITVSIITSIYTQSKPKNIPTKAFALWPLLSAFCLVFTMIFSFRAIEADKLHYTLTRHIARDSWTNAIQTSKQALTHGVINHWVLLWTAHAFHKENHTDQALSIYKACLKYHPNEKTAYWKIGVIELSLGNTEQARMALEYATFLDDDNAEFFFDLGTAYQLEGNLNDAYASYQKALSLGIDAPLIYMNLGQIYESKNAHNDAVRVYKQFLNKWRGERKMLDIVQERLHQLTPFP